MTSDKYKRLQGRLTALRRKQLKEQAIYEARLKRLKDSYSRKMSLMFDVEKIIILKMSRIDPGV